MSVSSGSTGPTEVIGDGFEGCVVKPAFPNNDGPHDRNVAKIFFRRGNAAEALAKNADLGLIGIEPSLFPYTRTFKGRNVPGSLRERCRVVSDEQALGVVRMTNLGVDFFTLLEQPLLVAQIQRLPLSQVLENGVKRLFQTILKLRKARRIHFDVRFENVLLDPATGTFTLIDYGRITEDKDIVKRSLAKHLYDQFPPEMMFWLSAQYEKWRGSGKVAADQKKALKAAVAAAEANEEAANAEVVDVIDEIQAVAAEANVDAAQKALALAKKAYKEYIETNDLQRGQWLDYMYTNGKKYKDLNELEQDIVRKAFVPSCELWTSIYPKIVNNIEKHGPSEVLTALKRITDLNTSDKDKLAGRAFEKMLQLAGEAFEILFDPAIEDFIKEGVATKEGLMASFKQQSIDTIDSYGAALCVLMFFNQYFAYSVNWLNCPPDVKNMLYTILLPMININYMNRVGIDDRTITELESLIERVKAREEGPSSSSAAASSSAASSSSSSSAASSAVKRAPSSGGRRAKKLKSRRRCPVRRRRTHRK